MGKEERKLLPTKQKIVPCPVLILEQKKLNQKIRISHTTISSFSIGFVVLKNKCTYHRC
jgi:hypothetical protein